MEYISNILDPLLERVIVCDSKDLRSYQDFYNKIYYLVTIHGRQKEKENNSNLYSYLKISIENYASKVVNDMNSIEDMSLEKYFEIWTSYYNFILRINVASSYFVRVYIKISGINSIINIGIDAWKKEASLDTNRAIKMMIEIFRDDREGKITNINLLKSIIICFDMIKVDYLTSLLAETHDYYNDKLCLYLQGVPNNEDLVRELYNWLFSEYERCKLLTEINAKAVMYVLDTLLVAEKAKSIKSLFKSSIRDRKYEDTRKTHILAKRVPNMIDDLAKSYEKHIIDTFSNKVEDLTSFRESLMNVIKEYLDNDKVYLHSIMRSYRYILNNRIHILDTVKYLDNLLHKSSKCKIVEDERVRIVEDLIDICFYYEAKDEFLVLYTKKLSNRLLHDGSYTDYLENVAFQRVKRVFGLECTQKMKIMLEDINGNRENTLGISEFNPIVLTTSVWNLSTGSEKVIVNDTIKMWQEKFTFYYKGIYPKRKISWDYEDSVVVVKYLNYQLVCSFYQYTILEQFNKKAVIDKNELKAMSGIKNEDIVTSLLKLKVLWPSKDGNKYTLNPRFKCELINVNCMKALTKEVVKETVNRDVDTSRKIQLYLIITRIMKNGKVMTHNDLKCEVFKQAEVRFIPTLEQFKLAIDYCIEKEIIEVKSRTIDSVVYSYIS